MRRLLASISITVIVVGGCFFFDARAQAITGGAQDNLARTGEPRKSDKSADAPDLSDLNLPESEMRAVIERYTVDRASLNRFYTVAFSPARRSRLKQFCSEWLSKLARVNFDSMSLEGQVDYLLFKNQLDYELRQLDIQSNQFAETETLIPFARVIIELEEARRRMEPVNSEKMAAMMTALNKQIGELRKQAENQIKPEEIGRASCRERV